MRQLLIVLCDKKIPKSNCGGGPQVGEEMQTPGDRAAIFPIAHYFPAAISAATQQLNSCQLASTRL